MASKLDANESKSSRHYQQGDMGINNTVLDCRVLLLYIRKRVKGELGQQGKQRSEQGKLMSGRNEEKYKKPM